MYRGLGVSRYFSCSLLELLLAVLPTQAIFVLFLVSPKLFFLALLHFQHVICFCSRLEFNYLHARYRKRQVANFCSGWDCTQRDRHVYGLPIHEVLATIPRPGNLLWSR